MGGEGDILVLGAGGKVGTLLRRYWARTLPRGARPVCQSRTRAADDVVVWRPGDRRRDLPAASTILALWGATPRAGEPLSLNEALGIEALEIARAIGARRVLLASSAAVYTGSDKACHAETDTPPVPASAYGQSKLRMEHAATEWLARQSHPPQVSILRMGNVVGADMLFAELDRGGPVCLDRFASGRGPARSYLTIPDLARVVQAIAAMPERALNGASVRILNTAGSRPLAMADLARLAGRQITWRTAPGAALEHLELDTSRLNALVGPLGDSSDPAAAMRSWAEIRGAA